MKKMYKIAIFPMTADILHAGHVLALKDAKAFCQELIVALNCCPDSKQPIQSVYERYTQLMGCKYVDRVIPYAGEKDLELLLMTVEHDARVIGSDYTNQLTNPNYYWTGKDWEEMNDVHLLVVQRDHGLSSSELKNRIIQKEKPDTV